MKITIQRVDDRIRFQIESHNVEFTQPYVRYDCDTRNWKGEWVPKSKGWSYDEDDMMHRTGETRSEGWHHNGAVTLTDRASRELIDEFATPYKGRYNPKHKDFDVVERNAHITILTSEGSIEIPIRKGGSWEGRYEV